MNNHLLDSQEFRTRIKSIREAFPHHWESSRKLMTPESLADALPILIETLQQAELLPDLQKRLIAVVQQVGLHRKSEKLHLALKDLTGLPPTKAIRALLVWGVLAKNDPHSDSTDIPTEDVERILKESRNPYDLLLHSSAPSLLDIGAGDLTFEQELVDQYIPQMPSTSLPLSLHAFDRLAPGSRVGGVYHKNPQHEQYLRGFPAEKLRFTFWGGIGVDHFERAKGTFSQYTMCTCHAPANPTFAYEPTRVDHKLIEAYLRSTRGMSRVRRYEGEPVLEVFHQGKALTFPPWKFDIAGPVALLRCMTQRSHVGVLSAIDDEVFWELLSQILAHDHYRPQDQILTKDVIPKTFGKVYDVLYQLAVGERFDLSSVAELRSSPAPRALHKEIRAPSLGFRYVEIRRGAIWEGIPSSFTSKQFSHMKEESPPWWIIFLRDS